MFKPIRTFFICLTGIVFLNGCSTVSHLDNHWFDPGRRTSYTDFKKVLVVAFIGSESGRRTAENTMVSELGSGNSIPAYTYNLSSQIIQNGTLVKDELIKKGFDAAFVLRFMEKEKDQRWIPGNIGLMQPVGGFLNNGVMMQNGMMFNGGFNQWGMNGFAPMWGWGMNMINDPGRYVTDKTYMYETDLYYLKKDNIVWSGVTTTMNPSGFINKINSIVKTVTSQMKKDGVY
jgi:hypothetical protein